MTKKNTPLRNTWVLYYHMDSSFVILLWSIVCDMQQIEYVCNIEQFDQLTSKVVKRFWEAMILLYIQGFHKLKMTICKYK